MPITSVTTLVQQVARVIGEAYPGVADGRMLFGQPTEGEVGLPYVAGMELPVIYPSWEFQFVLPHTVDICRSERDRHTADAENPHFPHAWMIDTETFKPTGVRFLNSREYFISLKVWLLYGYYHGGSAEKFREHYTRVASYMDDNLAELKMPDSQGLIEASHIDFLSTDTHNFESAIMWVAQGRQEFTVEF